MAETGKALIDSTIFLALKFYGSVSQEQNYLKARVELPCVVVQCLATAQGCQALTHIKGPFLLIHMKVCCGPASSPARAHRLCLLT